MGINFAGYYLRLIPLNFHKYLVLVYFNIFEIFVSYGQIRMLSQEALKAINSQAPLVQLLRVEISA